MKISEMYQRQHPVISFEFFPPKTDAGMTSLLRTLDHLKTLSPSFVSVTYGAGGSTRDKTVDLARRIKRDTGIETMSHLSCVGATKAEIEAVLQELQGAGIDNVLALGGDPPRDQEVRDKSEWAFVHANELAAHIKTKQYFCIGGACYPEGLSDNPSTPPCTDPDRYLFWDAMHPTAHAHAILAGAASEALANYRFQVRVGFGAVLLLIAAYVFWRYYRLSTLPNEITPAQKPMTTE